MGITNIVERASVAANELSETELVQGFSVLMEKVEQYTPSVVAVLGVEAFRKATGHKKAQVGKQPAHICPRTNCTVSWWVLPNPSGLNAHFRPTEMAALFSQLRR